MRGASSVRTRSGGRQAVRRSQNTLTQPRREFKRCESVSRNVSSDNSRKIRRKAGLAWQILQEICDHLGDG